MDKVVITGGSGLLGAALTRRLMGHGYEVVHLTRRKRDEPVIPRYLWDYRECYLEAGALDDVGYIIHLAGANIAGARWSDPRKREIMESRVKTTELLLEEVKKRNVRLKGFVCASAAGYYGAQTTGKIMQESDPPGGDFGAAVCKQWEKAAGQFEELPGVRTVIIRLGIVLSPEGGALPGMLTPAKMGLAAPLGTGKQMIPWIHIEDACRLFAEAVINDRLRGTYNAVAGNESNSEFMGALARASGRPFFMPSVPAFVLRIMFGEMADALLKGNAVSGEKAEATGFRYLHNNLDDALKNLLSAGSATGRGS